MNRRHFTNFFKDLFTFILQLYKMLKCAHCPFSTENKSELSLHTFLKHKKDSDSKKRKNSSPSNSKAEKKSKIECSKCDFVAQEQFYMDIHKEVCKGQEAVEAVSEDEVEAENDGNVANGPPTPKVEVFGRIFNFFKVENRRPFY